MEELRGAAFLCAVLGITPETRDDHAAYIAFMAESPERRQAVDLHRRQPRADGHRLSACAATSRGKGPRLGWPGTKLVEVS